MRQLNFANLVAAGNFGQASGLGYLQHIYWNYGSVNNVIYTHVSVDGLCLAIYAHVSRHIH